MAYAGRNGWADPTPNDDTWVLTGIDFEHPDQPIEIMVLKKHDGRERYLQFNLPTDVGGKFLLTRDGIEDLKLFLKE